jgi:uncharacterized protein YcbK (DUF882 family)
MRYFKPEEFISCKPSCSVEQMNASFLQKLDTARELAQVPFVLLSAYRSPEHDLSRGRSGRGYHTLGRAVDVKCIDGLSRWRIIYACMRLSLSVGVYSDFLHIDDRPNCIVFYGK